MNEIVNTVSNEVPISREELAAFYSASMIAQNEAYERFNSALIEQSRETRNMFDQLIMAITDKFQAYMDQNQQLIDAIKSIATPQADDINDKLITTLSRSEINKWLQDVWSRVRAIGSISKKQAAVIFSEAYTCLEDEHQLNLDNLFFEYSKRNRNKVKLNMIAESDFLRPKMDECIGALEKKYQKKHVPFSVEIRSVPDSVRRIIAEYAQRNGLSYPHASSKIYNVLNNMLGIDLKGEARQYAAQFGYLGCNTGYYISTQPELMEQLELVAKEA